VAFKNPKILVSAIFLTQQFDFLFGKNK